MDIILTISQCIGAIGFFIYLVLKINNHRPNDDKAKEKFKLKMQQKSEKIKTIYPDQDYSVENIKDRISVIDIELATSSNNTNAVLFFIPFLYGLILPYLTVSLDFFSKAFSIIILFIMGFLYPYLGYKNDKTYDLKVELRVLEDILDEVK